MTQWFIAKYMPDLRRREPRNVGIVLFAGDRMLSRFLGEDTCDSGKIDGRSIRHKVGSSDNYRDWVHFWRTAAAGGPDQIITRRPADNYYLERGGQQLAGGAAEPEALLSRLFAQLVADVEEPTEEETEERRADPVVQLFESVAITLPFTQNYVVDLNYDEHVFDYAVKTERTTLLFRHVVLNGNPKKTWDAVHTAAFATQEVAEAAHHLAEHLEPYVIVAKRDAGPGAPKQMRALEHKVGGRLRQAAGAQEDRDWLMALAATKGTLGHSA
jgi:hypothetical protein